MTAPTTAAGRTLALLRHVAAGGATTNLSELSRLTGVNRVTAMRLLEDLEAEGALERVDGGHRIGLELLKLAGLSLRSADLTELGRRSLEALSRELELTAYLVVLDGGHALYLMRSVPTTPLVSNVAVGSRIPAHLVTPGRALLLGRDEATLVALLGDDPLPTATASSPSTHEQLRRLLDEEAAAGAAWSAGDYEQGVDACASPVRDRDGHAVAALSVAGPTAAVGGRRASVQEAVTREAAALSALLAS